MCVCVGSGRRGGEIIAIIALYESLLRSVPYQNAGTYVGSELANELEKAGRSK